MKLSYEYETGIIEFDVVFSNRRTMAIQIEPPDKIKVLSPKGAKKDEILKAVKGKSKWIVQKLFQLDEMEALKKTRKMVNGENLLYMGVDYHLEIIVDKIYKKPELELFRDVLYVYINIDDKDKIRLALKNWYKEKSLEKVRERVTYYQKYFELVPNKIMVKEQKRRWGSCTSARNLYFNWKIIMAPSHLLDYLVVHEMCHMVHMNHSAEYWNLVRSILPDYKERRDLLKNQGVKYDLE